MRHTGLLWTTETFKIDNDQIRNVLGLKGHPGFRYKLTELEDKFETLQKEREKAEKTPKENRDLYQTKLLEFASRLSEFVRVNQLAFRGIPPESLASEWTSIADRKAEYLDKARKEAAAKADSKFGVHFEPGNPSFDILPKEKKEEIGRFQLNMLKPENERLQREDAGLSPWMNLINAYRDKDVALQRSRREPGEERRATHAQTAKRVEIGSVLQSLRAALQFDRDVCFRGGSGVDRLAADRLEPRAFAAVPLGVIFANRLHASDSHLRLAGSDVHSGPAAGHESVFVGRVYRFRRRALVHGAGVDQTDGHREFRRRQMGFATTIIAHNLATSGDTLEMMQAVLDTNFWLATHVTTVTLGYAATYIAGAVGLVYLALYVLPPEAALKKTVLIGGPGAHPMELGRVIGQIIYGVACFATLLSFTGTVLGGIWADQSWGRFGGGTRRRMGPS